jgi:hypothetical protein
MNKIDYESQVKNYLSLIILKYDKIVLLIKYTLIKKAAMHFLKEQLCCNTDLFCNTELFTYKKSGYATIRNFSAIKKVT